MRIKGISDWNNISSNAKVSLKIVDEYNNTLISTKEFVFDDLALDQEIRIQFSTIGVIFKKVSCDAYFPYSFDISYKTEHYIEI